MRDTHAIVEDSDFWSRLEYAASAWLGSSQEKRLRRYWIDGFIPETAKNTQRGADIEGNAWLAEGSRQQYECRFIASIPQKLLHRRAQFHIDDMPLMKCRSKSRSVCLFPLRLTKRSSQPLAAPMSSFFMTSTANAAAKLALASGG
jgi:hypothetical protein